MGGGGVTEYVLAPDESARVRQAEATKLRVALKSIAPIAAAVIMVLIIGKNIGFFRQGIRGLDVEMIILLFLVTPSQWYYGILFHRGARKAIKHRMANMDVLVSLS